MDPKLYSKIMCALTLGQLAYLDDLDKLNEPEDHEDVVLLRDLMSAFSPSDVRDIILDFMYWYRHKDDNKTEE